MDSIETIDNKIINAERSVSCINKIICLSFRKYLQESKNSKEVLLTKIFNFKKGEEPGFKNYKMYLENDLSLIKHYRVKDLNSICNTYIDEKLTNARSCIGDIMVSFDGTIGKVDVGVEGSYSAGIRKIDSRYDKIHNSFIYAMFMDENTIKNIIKQSSGSNIKHASEALNYIALKIGITNIEYFQRTCDNLYCKMINLIKHINVLKKYKSCILSYLLNNQIN